jgi:hypothetical protein
MRKIVCVICLCFLFPILLSAQLKKLKVDKVECEIESIETCGNLQYGYLVLSTTLRNLNFEVSECDILKIDSTDIKGYILCISCCYGNVALTISSSVHKEISNSVNLRGCYEISEKKGIIKQALTSPNNYLSQQLGKGISYSPMGGGFGVSFEYRFGEKVGWGLQVGGGYYSIYKEYTGTYITGAGNNKTNYPHFSISLKNYPLLWIKKKPTRNLFPSLARNFYLGASYGILGSKKIEPYNNTDGSFSLGGIRTMHGVSMMVGEDYKIPFKGQESFGYMLSGGLGAAYSTNLKTWKFAYNVGFGIYWKFNRK